MSKCELFKLPWRVFQDRDNTKTNTGLSYRKGSDNMTHRPLEMQLVRVPKLLEGLMSAADDLDWGLALVEGLQDSLGSCRGPETSRFTVYLRVRAWGSSKEESCWEESHCLWNDTGLWIYIFLRLKNKHWNKSFHSQVLFDFILNTSHLSHIRWLS